MGSKSHRGSQFCSGKDLLRGVALIYFALLFSRLKSCIIVPQKFSEGRRNVIMFAILHIFNALHYESIELWTLVHGQFPVTGVESFHVCTPCTVHVRN